MRGNRTGAVGTALSALYVLLRVLCCAVRVQIAGICAACLVSRFLWIITMKETGVDFDAISTLIYFLTTELLPLTIMLKVFNTPNITPLVSDTTLRHTPQRRSCAHERALIDISRMRCVCLALARSHALGSGTTRMDP